MNKIKTLCLCYMLTISGAATASSFVDYGGFGKYKQGIAKGGGCISAVIGTTIPGKNFNVIVNYASKESGDKAEFNKGYFGFSTLDKKHDLVDGKLRASAVMLCLKPGEYNIIGIEMNRQMSTQPIRIPFTVTAGKNHYLGRLLFHNDTVRAVSCGSLASNGVEIQNQYLQDSALIASLKGALPPEASLLDASRGMPYFYSCKQS